MTHPMFDDPAQAAEYGIWRQAHQEEYGTWVANGDIHVGNALAFPDGVPVPASTVAAQGWDDSGQVRPAPGTEPVDERERLLARQAELDAERAAIEAALAASDTQQAPGEDEPAAYADKNVTQLRDALRSRQLPVSGTRPELIARLAAADETQE